MPQGIVFFVLSLSIDNTMNNIPCFVLHKVVYLRGLEEVLTCDFSSLLSSKITINLQEIIISHFIYLLLLHGFSKHFSKVKQWVNQTWFTAQIKPSIDGFFVFDYKQAHLSIETDIVTWRLLIKLISTILWEDLTNRFS